MNLYRYISKNKLTSIIICGVILLPIILHLNDINLRQYNFHSIFLLSLFHIFVSLIILFLSIFFSLFKKNFYLSEILICNFSIFYLLFYYRKINNFEIIQFLNSYSHLLDNFLTLFFYLIVYLIFFYLLKKYKNFTKIFILNFIIINLLYGFNNMGLFNVVNFHQDKNFYSENNINLKEIFPPKDKDNINIYLIILDGMVSLNKANEYGIVSNKEDIIEKLAQKDFRYNKEFNSNYSVTYASIQSLLYGNFPVTENSPKYNNRLSFFPYLMSDKENFFYQMMNNLDMNFFWIGNKWGLCNGLKDGECFYNYKEKNNYFSKVLRSSELLYANSLFSYLINYLNKNMIITAFDFLKYSKKQTPYFKSYKKNNFYLIHVYKPHKPFNLNKNCEDINPKIGSTNEKEYYGYSYNCILKTVLSWDERFLNKKENNLVIILGDHGWSFDNNNIMSLEFTKSRINDVFFAYKVPSICKSINPPKSHVNVMRYILKCLGNDNIRYLEDTQYILRYEGHKDYGKAIRIMN